MRNSDSLKIAGKFLKSQREKKEFTVEEVCIALRLEKEIIFDIETGNFGKFKSYLFLRGYIKNYANFLGVEVNLPEVEIKKNKKISSKKYSDGNLRGNKKVIIYIITFLIFIFTLYLFYNKNSEEVTISSSTDIKNTNIEKIENNISIEPAEIDSNIIHKESKNIQEFHINENKILLEKSFNSNDNLSVLSNNDDDSKNININPITLVNPAADAFLEITYKGDSWTEIIDSKGDIVFFDLVKRGKTIKFNILAPFEILLGDATVVNIKYNNKLIGIPYFNPDTNVGKIKVK